MPPLRLSQLIEAATASKGTIARTARVKPRDGTIGATSKAISTYFYTSIGITETATVGRLYPSTAENVFLRLGT